MKRSIKKLVALCLALMMATSLLAGCGGGSENGESGETGVKKELVVGTEENVTTLDPQASNSRPNLALYWLTHNTLINNNDGEFENNLTESYEQTDDVTWVFHLRKGVKFHNGEELKASDVKFTYTRAVDSSYTSEKVQWISEINTPDDYTVELKLSAPVQDILFFLADKTLSILNEKAVTENPDDGFKIGTGPYVLREWVLNDHTTVDRFADYFGEQPKSEVITFRIIPEASARLISLQTDEIDVCLFPARIDLDTVRGNSDLQLMETGGDTMHYLTFNTTRAPFDDVRVRQGLAYAIDREKVIEVATEGNGVPAYSFFSPGYGLTEDVEHYNTDMDKAVALLKDAGYSESNKLSFTMSVSGDVKLLQAQAIQQCFNATGLVDMQIESMELTALKALFKDANYDASLYNWANENAGPDMNVRPLLHTGSGSNRSHFGDAAIDELMDKALVEVDDTARLALYAEIQKDVIDQLPIMPLYYDTVYVAATAKLQDFTPNCSEVHRFTYAYVTE